MNEQHIIDRIAAHKTFFASGQTRSIKFRKMQLLKLRHTIEKYEPQLYAALWHDLHKSESEAFLTEISIVYQEIKHHSTHLKHWTKPRRVKSPLQLWPSRSYILYEPLGVALIIAPWNYPFHLLFNPLIGAISAGCCAVLKPSPYVPQVSKVMAKIVTEAFDKNYISLIEGNRDTNTLLLKQHFDMIFFTGSPTLGRIVMQYAAQHLTPCILELGGKSPCIVDKTADIKTAAHRIIWGKTINAGQTCIAPDYLFVHADIKAALIEEMKKTVNEFFGATPKSSPFYPRIVNDKAMTRLKALMQHGHIIFGGEIDDTERYIAPTLIDDIEPNFPIMQEEIFGPLLPMLTFDDMQTVVDYINNHNKPLALYYFGNATTGRQIFTRTTSGGGCLNDTLLHIGNARLPFGGVGNSGMGKYHRYESFLAFSNRRAIVQSSTMFDLTVKFAPFRGLNTIKHFLK